jgi:hypothetical protein
MPSFGHHGAAAGAVSGNNLIFGGKTVAVAQLRALNDSEIRELEVSQRTEKTSRGYLRPDFA